MGNTIIAITKSTYAALAGKGNAVVSGAFLQQLLQTVFSMALLTANAGKTFTISAAVFTGSMIAGRFVGNFRGNSSTSGAFDIKFGVPTSNAGSGLGFMMLAAIMCVAIYWYRSRKASPTI